MYNIASSTIASTTKTKHIFANGEPIATFTTVGATTTKQYLHADHLGDITVSTDSTGALSEVTDYYPYGSQRVHTGSFTEQRKFIGQNYDTDSSLSYLNARYYDGARGQFVSQDPVFWGQQDITNPQSLNSPRTTGLNSMSGFGFGNSSANQNWISMLADPQQMNSYAYARGNPITNSDPTGLYSIGLNYGVNAEAGVGLFGAVTLSGSVNYVVDDNGNASIAFTTTYGSASGLQEVGNISYPENPRKQTGVVLGSAGSGFSVTYSPTAKKPRDLAGVSNNKSVTTIFGSFQSSKSNGQSSYTVGFGGKGPGSVSSYRTNTTVVKSYTIQQLSNMLSQLKSTLKALQSKKSST